MKTVFIGGSRVGATEKGLSKPVILILDKIMSNNNMVIVGDANGVDKAAQQYFKKKYYKKVNIYYSGDSIRNREDMDWKVVHINSKEFKGRERQMQKDIEMSKVADSGFMIWDDVYKNRFGKTSVSSGTLSNIINLLSQNKPVVVYYVPIKKIFTLNSFGDFEDSILPHVDAMTAKKYEELKNKNNTLPTLFD